MVRIHHLTPVFGATEDTLICLVWQSSSVSICPARALSPIEKVWEPPAETKKIVVTNRNKSNEALCETGRDEERQSKKWVRVSEKRRKGQWGLSVLQRIGAQPRRMSRDERVCRPTFMSARNQSRSGGPNKTELKEKIYNNNNIKKMKKPTQKPPTDFYFLTVIAHIPFTVVRVRQSRASYTRRRR